MAEYMHETIFNITEEYGKDTFMIIKYLGTRNIHRFFKMKEKLENFINRVFFLPKNTLSRFLFYLVKFFPQHLPRKLAEFRDNYEHHLILSMSENGIDEIKKYLEKNWNNCPNSSFFACSHKEGEEALLHRFAAGGAAGNYQSINSDQVEGIVALDIALRRNDEDWVDNIPKNISNDIVHSLYYGHFLCNVFHRNYIIKKGVDKNKIKLKILDLLDKKGAKYPAEHNVGHMYKADCSLQDFYRKLDPTNTFNPGIGKTKKSRCSNSCNCCQ